MAHNAISHDISLFQVLFHCQTNLTKAYHYVLDIILIALATTYINKSEAYSKV